MLRKNKTKIYDPDSANADILQRRKVAVIGYGNQGRAQALNLRDNGIDVIVGNNDDDYAQRAVDDGFVVLNIPTSVSKADVVMLLIPDEVLPAVFEKQILPNLKSKIALVFASGYNLAFEQIKIPSGVDVLLLAPRMIGVGIRERFLSKQGFYCLVGVAQDASGEAEQLLLALTWGIGGLDKPAIEVTFKQEAILDLFNEQAFGPAFGRVLLTSIALLLERGLPPEAVLVEMYISEEMAYTYQKMAQAGLVRQTLFHSPTSQYGAMSRGTRFLGMGLRRRMARIFDEIDSGAFANEWSGALARLKFKVIRYFAMRQSINQIEKQVRVALSMKPFDGYQPSKDLDNILEDPEIQAHLKTFEETFEF